MAAKVPRERVIGSLNYNTAPGWSELTTPTGFPFGIYEKLRLRLSGIHNKAGSVLGAVVAENPFTVVKSIMIKITGTDFIEVPLTDLVVLSHYIHQRPGKAPFTTPSTTAFANETIEFDVDLPFALTDMVAPRRGFFAANRYNTVTLRVNWGVGTDLVSGGTYTTNAIDPSTRIDVVAKEWSQETAFESAPNLLLHKRSYQVYDMGAGGSALANKEWEIPRDPSLLRGILLKQMTDGPETPITTLYTGAKELILRYNKSDRKLEYTWAMLQRMNTDAYRTALPTGYAFIDLAPDGDFATLQDTSQGVYELLLNTVAVANSKLRATIVRYGASN